MARHRSDFDPRPYYAREFGAGEPSVYVRFATATSRQFWISRNPTNREPLPPDASAIQAMEIRGVTWEYVDGVSYAREPG
jgi:hypothetical protein